MKLSFSGTDEDMLELPHAHLQNAQCGRPKHFLQYNQYEEEIDKSKLIILCTM